MTTRELNERASRWISVTFLQGDEADEVLTMIDRDGATGAIEYLQHWDYGEETTGAALENGYVYDRIPAGSTDRTIESDGSNYALTYSTTFGYVSLLRRHPVDSESELVPASRASAMQTARAHPDVADPWVASRDRYAARRRVAL
ncbi:hypothetical protein E3T26_11025 [Cryobacterium sp. TMT1-21]|uniref:hypothetical protein n=1 Tax=Cryobacterium sp. TMT1-21 TaxID=1259234 RepID=UPI00106B5DD7|nr:hypothetical protein [Cryobacterium sp. TMT1-21]TFD12635.1 hypothetical protein E3T26_11025 [Cryobacterium sp. TMT1-21]